MAKLTQNPAPVNPNSIPGEPVGHEVSPEEAKLKTAKRVLFWGVDALEQYVIQAKELANTLNDKTTLQSMLDDAKWLRGEIWRISSLEDADAVFTEFNSRLEKKAVAPTTFQLLHKLEEIRTASNATINALVADGGEESYQSLYRQYLATDDLNEDPKKRSVLETLWAKVTFPIRVYKTDRELFKSVAVAEAVAAGSVALNVTGGEYVPGTSEISDTFKLITGMSFAAYTIYIALLLNSEEGKITRGSTALEALSGALVSYVRMAPETAGIVKEILQYLEKSVRETGTLNFDDLMKFIGDATSKDTNELVQNDRYTKVEDRLYDLREAFRQGITLKSDTVINYGGYAITLMAGLSGKNPAESALLAGTTGAMIGILQDIVHDMDKPYGEQGTMKLSTAPLEAALIQVEFAEREALVRDDMRKVLDAVQALDQEISGSFYADFRKIFEPYYEQLKSVGKAVDQLQDQKLSALQVEKGDKFNPLGVAKILGEVEAFRQALMSEIVKLEPRFFVGAESRDHGVFDMDKEITFRYNDDFSRQLALLEAVREKFMTDEAMDDDEKTGEAIKILDRWIEKIKSAKGMVQSGKAPQVESKTTEQEIEHAVSAILGEITGNIQNHGKASYVFKRESGAGKIETQTANRTSDWEGENVKALLTPIQYKVIQGLYTAISRDPDNRGAYEQVIEDINRTRLAQELPAIFETVGR